ncbi:MAG TPA: MBL fold metallo-hydrolase [Solirubrobacteraceae bacterium]|nr:MBL fold metallo-hydrolase [Solirubrobacteraceae bacterium]
MTAAITWLGHATALLELDGVRLLTDPVLRNRIGPLVRIAAEPRLESPQTLDGVLLSHLHADHTDVPTLRRIAPPARVLAPRPSAAWLRRALGANVQELSPGDTVGIGRVAIRATPAVHDSRRRPLGRRAEPVGYLVAGSIRVYFAGDTDLFDAMIAMRGEVDVALLPVWGWGPSLGPGHLDPLRAALAAALIAPTVAIPVHWGTFALAGPARRPSDPGRPAREFAALARQHAPGVEVRLLVPGGRTEL